MAKRMSYSDPSCFLLNAKTGKKHDISYNKDFVIGQSHTCSIIINEQYISPFHCIIQYQDDRFVIFDNKTSSGTFVNCQKILEGKDNRAVLKHGDLITLGDERRKHFIYKFCLNSKATEIHKCDCKIKRNNAIVATLKDGNYSSSLALQSEVSNQNDIEDVTKNVSQFHETLLIQKEPSMNLFKSQIKNLLENYLMCPICHELLDTAYVTTCNHTICGSCLSSWFNQSAYCPVCRTCIQNANRCLALENFVDDICEIMGGDIKEKRNNLRKERDQVLSSSNNLL